MNEIEKTIKHLTMLRRLDSGEKKYLYDIAISALEAQQADMWIPITEKLPENGMKVLVTNGREPYPINCVAVRENREWRVAWNHDRFGTIKIVAWKPLPEPYKEEQL